MQLELSTITNDYARWLKSYMRHLKYKESSKNTLESYRRILQMLSRFIAAQKLAKNLSDLNKEFFMDFLEDVEGQSKTGQFSKTTKQLYLTVLKSFFIYISDNNDNFYTFENEMKLLDPRVRGIFITPGLIALHEV